MSKDLFTFLVGGKAGEGVKKAGSVAAHIFSSMGRHVFQMDDYMSLIRGGHNFSVVSTSIKWLSSHYMKSNLVVNFDKRSCNTHINDIVEDGIMVYNSDELDNIDGIGIPLSSEAEKYPMKKLMYGVGAVAVLSSTIGFTKEQMEPGWIVPLMGNTYSGSSPTGFSATLDVSKPGDLILLVSFGSGAGSDGFIFKVTERINAVRDKAEKLKSMLEDNLIYLDYGQYAKFREKIIMSE